MNVKNCRKCGKMFNYISGMAVCPACRESAEEKFQEVKKFVQDNKSATVNEIVENCGVDSNQIKQWVREERLFFSDESPIKINCEICGAQIATGRYCEQCKKNTADTFSNASKRPEMPKMEPTSSQAAGLRMHTFKEN